MATITKKKESRKRVESKTVKKSKFLLAWEKMTPKEYEIVDMRAVLR